ARSTVMVGAMTAVPVHSTITDGSSDARSAALYGESATSAYSVGTVWTGRTSPLSRAHSTTWLSRKACAAPKAAPAAVPNRDASAGQLHASSVMSSSGTANDRAPSAYTESNLDSRAAVSAGSE